MDAQDPLASEQLVPLTQPEPTPDELFKSGREFLYGLNKVQINIEEGSRRIIAAAGRHVLASGFHAHMLGAGDIIKSDGNAFYDLSHKRILQNDLVYLANYGHPLAQTTIAALAEFGFNLTDVKAYQQKRKSYWVPKWAKAAAIFELHRLAATQNTQECPEAEFRLATCYISGSGVKADTKLAIQFTQSAAEKGLAIAQFTLGAFYSGTDNHMEPNPIETRKWIESSASQGYSPARAALIDLTKK